MGDDDAMAAGLPFPEPDGELASSGAVRVGPGEFLVISFATGTPSDFRAMRRELEKQFPEIAHRILLVAGGAQLAVITKDGKGTDD